LNDTASRIVSTGTAKDNAGAPRRRTVAAVVIERELRGATESVEPIRAQDRRLAFLTTTTQAPAET
jgi:hypothetical protein